MKTDELILSIVFFLFVTGIFTFISAKKKKDSWEGVLIKKENIMMTRVCKLPIN